MFKRYRFIYKQEKKLFKSLAHTSFCTWANTNYINTKPSSTPRLPERGWKLYWCYFRQLYFFSPCFCTLLYYVGMQSETAKRGWLFVRTLCSQWMALVWKSGRLVVVVVLLFRAIVFTFFLFLDRKLGESQVLVFARSYGEFFSVLSLVLSTWV